MREQLQDISELNAALVANFRLKAKIISVLFGAVLFMQVCAITFVATQTDLPGKSIPYRMMVIGPSLLFLFFVAEVIAFRYLTSIRGTTKQVKTSFIYLSTFVETSFPCAIMFLIGNFMQDSQLFEPMKVVSSALLVVLFIMIVLSSLLLDPRLSFFAGVTGGTEYFLINIFFLRNEITTPVDYGNAILKSVFIIVCGLITGFVSRKIREAVISSLHSKNELIYNLDKRVAEKTVEVLAQKDEIERKNVLLEEKQKEILDSIHYARRIQHTQLPTERFIVKTLEKLRN